jgi:hypothetical protein
MIELHAINRLRWANAPGLESSELPVGCPFSKRRGERFPLLGRELRDVVFTEAACDAQDDAELLEHALTSIANFEVLFETTRFVRLHRAVEVFGDHLHEVVAREVIDRWVHDRSLVSK